MTKQNRGSFNWFAFCALSLTACGGDTEHGPHDHSIESLGGAKAVEDESPDARTPRNQHEPDEETPVASEPCAEGEELTDDQCMGDCENGAIDSPECSQCAEDKALVDGSCVALCDNAAIDPPSCNTCEEGDVLANGRCEAPCDNGALDPPGCSSCGADEVFVNGACHGACTNARHDPTQSCASCLPPFAGYPNCAQCENAEQDPAYNCWTNEEKRNHLLSILSKADHAQYECETAQGKIYFRYSYGINQPDQNYLYFYPVYNTAEPEASCNNPANGEVRGSQSCNFFNSSWGRWSLYLHDPLNFLELPLTITQSIASSYDCDNEALKSGVTKEICKQAYTCSLYTLNAAWPTMDDDEDGVQNAEDCAPDDAQRWHYQIVFADDDFDGVPTSQEHIICTGSSLPPSYIKELSHPDNCPKYYNPDQEDSDGDSVGNLCDVNHLDLNDQATRESHFAKLLAKAQSSTYECATPRGKVYFKWAYGAATTTQDYFYAYPTSSGAVGSCTNPENPVSSGRDQCVFYEDSSGRWSLSLGRPTELTTLPSAFFATIGVPYDCENYSLQSGVTPEMCSAKYWCTLYK